MGTNPNQITTWMHQHIPSEDTGDDDEPWFLYALRDTVGGDRQAVWEGGGGGRGIVAVVDFGDPKLYVNSRWRSWGVTTMLDKPISPQMLQADPVLGPRFTPPGMKSLQGRPKRLSEEEGAALDRLAGGLPAQRLPQRLPRAGEPVEDWFGRIELDPEKTFETAVYMSKHLSKRIGFPEAPLVQQRLRCGSGETLIPTCSLPASLVR
jgi:hypothetical protein